MVKYLQNSREDVQLCFIQKNVEKRAEHKELRAREEDPHPPICTGGGPNPS